MQQIWIDLSRQMVHLNQSFTVFLSTQYDKHLKKLVEKAISKFSTIMFNVYDLLENWKTGKVTTMVLSFLDEADYILDVINSKIPLKKVEHYIHITRELIQVVRTYVVFLDQKRQEYFAF
ncbi:MAG: hypothetical protein U0T73_14345 [Chitinophagales bacterium]